MDVKPKNELHLVAVDKRNISIDSPIITGIPPIKQNPSKKPMFPVTSRLTTRSNCKTTSRPPAVNPPPIPLVEEFRKGSVASVVTPIEPPYPPIELFNDALLLRGDGDPDLLPPKANDPKEVIDPSPSELTTPKPLVFLAIGGAVDVDPDRGRGMSPLILGLGLGLEVEYCCGENAEVNAGVC